MAAFTVIDHTELTGTAVSWEKTSIPSSYDHLLIKASMRSADTGNNASCKLRVNGETASTNYSYTTLRAATSTPSSVQYTSEPQLGSPTMTAAAALADTFSPVTIWIPNYANTANFKQVLWYGGNSYNSTTDWDWQLKVTAALWSNTDAIDQVTLITGVNFVEFSTFTLYGVTGA